MNIIYSYDNRREKEPRDCLGYEVSGVNEFKHLAAVSGGLFMEINSFDINEINGIMEEAVGESKVYLLLYLQWICSPSRLSYLKQNRDAGDEQIDFE